MKKTFALTIFTLSTFFASACNLSYASVDSIVPNGPNYSIYINACFGGGILGVTAGADNDTRTFSISLYSAVPITVISYAPANLTGDTTGCSMPGLLAGPGLGANENLLYVDPGCGFPFMCVSNTAACGLPHSQCEQFVLQTNVLPDSIRFLGIEGNGNPAAGCATDPGLLINFAVVLSVDWGVMSVVALDERTRRISWETYSEQNNDYFEVQRWFAGTHHWETIKTIEGAGNSNNARYYEYLDEIYLLGQDAYYRIKQVDFNGNYQYSKMMHIETLPVEVPISLAPNPTDGMVKIIGVDVDKVEVELLSSAGVLSTIQLNPDGTFSTSSLSNGVYFVRIQHDGKTTTQKLLVQ